MTAKTPDFPLHYIEDKPVTGYDYVSKGTIPKVAPDPRAEHSALLTLIERGHLDLIPMLGLDGHTCTDRCNRRNAT